MAYDITAVKAVLAKRDNLKDYMNQAYQALLMIQTAAPILAADPLFSTAYPANYTTFLNTLVTRCKALTDNWPQDPT